MALCVTVLTELLVEIKARSKSIILPTLKKQTKRSPQTTRFFTVEDRKLLVFSTEIWILALRKRKFTEIIKPKFTEGMHEMSGWERAAPDLGDQEAAETAADMAGDW